MDLDKKFSCKIFFSRLKLKYCIRYQKCFFNGFCELDKLDEKAFIRKNIENTDIITLISPALRIKMIIIRGKSWIILAMCYCVSESFDKIL